MKTIWVFALWLLALAVAIKPEDVEKRPFGNTTYLYQKLYAGDEDNGDLMIATAKRLGKRCVPPMEASHLDLPQSTAAEFMLWYLSVHQARLALEVKDKPKYVRQDEWYWGTWQGAPVLIMVWRAVLDNPKNNYMILGRCALAR